MLAVTYNTHLYLMYMCIYTVVTIFPQVMNTYDFDLDFHALKSKYQLWLVIENQNRLASSCKTNFG